MESDTEIVGWLLWVIALFVICLVIFRKWHQPALPRRSVINLPDKIQFERNSNNDYGVGTSLLDVVTIGGHGRLKEARYQYENHYLGYARSFNNSIDLRSSINDQLNNLGEYTYAIINELQRSRKLLNRPSQTSKDFSRTSQFELACEHIYQ